MKRIFSINLKSALRNYTVKDLIELKGKKQLTQINVSTPEEAAAAQEAKIDLIIAPPTGEIKKIRSFADKIFLTVGIPFLKYESKDKITKKAFELIEIGVDSIHCGSWNLDFMSHLNKFNIPFQGHAGFVPSQTTWIGSIRAYGKNFEEAKNIYNHVKKIENTGAWAVEIECIPEKIMSEITKETNMLTISIGSGQNTDIQFLFAEDILGYSSIKTPRHAKVYRNFIKLYEKLQKERVNAFKEFKRDVSSKKFPSKKNIISIKKEELDLFKKFINKN